MSKRFSEFRKTLANRIRSWPSNFDHTRLDDHLMRDVGLEFDSVTRTVRRITN